MRKNDVWNTAEYTRDDEFDDEWIRKDCNLLEVRMHGRFPVAAAACRVLPGFWPRHIHLTYAETGQKTARRRHGA